MLPWLLGGRCSAGTGLHVSEGFVFGSGEGNSALLRDMMLN